MVVGLILGYIAVLALTNYWKLKPPTPLKLLHSSNNSFFASESLSQDKQSLWFCISGFNLLIKDGNRRVRWKVTRHSICDHTLQPTKQTDDEGVRGAGEVNIWCLLDPTYFKSTNNFQTHTRCQISPTSYKRFFVVPKPYKQIFTHLHFTFVQSNNQLRITTTYLQRPLFWSPVFHI